MAKKKKPKSSLGKGPNSKRTETQPGVGNISDFTRDPYLIAQIFLASFAAFAWFIYGGQGLLFKNGMQAFEVTFPMLAIAGLICGLIVRNIVQAVLAGLFSVILIFSILSPAPVTLIPGAVMIILGLFLVLLFALLGNIVKILFGEKRAYLGFLGILIVHTLLNLLTMVNPS